MKTIHCSDLTKEIDSLLNDGYRLDMIMPADDPREAIVSKDGALLKLFLHQGSEVTAKSSPPSEGGVAAASADGVVLCSAEPSNNWIVGRAGMEYRDLISDRLGGRVIASHIRITEGGDVPDYVHYHKVHFQMIYCKSGWIRVVYEAHGEPFVLEAGDCVLQPPEIRHRVLESSAGSEVIEVSSPAEHETWVEHEIKLPTSELRPDRDFNGQRFVRHIGREANWISTGQNTRVADTGIEDSTRGLACVRIVKIAAHGTANINSGDAFVFVFVLSGAVLPTSKYPTFHTDDYMVITDRSAFSLTALEDSEILEVRLRQL